MIRKLKIRTILIALITLFIGSLATSYSIVNSDDFLKSFKITNFTNVNTKYHLEYEKTKNATVYEVIIYDESSEIIFNEKTTENVVDFDLNNLRYDEKYKLVIYAYDKNGESISVKNPYEFTYTEPSFSKDNNLVLDNNEDYTLYIDGELNKDNKNYQIGLYDNNVLIYKEEIKDNEYIIKQKYFNGLTQTLTAKLFDNDTEINSITLYSNTSPISDITIVSPQNDALLDYQDVPLTFTGGDNATEYILEIFKDDILIKEVSLNQNRAIISSEFFVKDNNYTFKIKAKYLDYESYSKEATVSFKMKEKETLLPVYINKDSNYIKENSYITLNNPNNKGTIYYTLDGSTPTPAATRSICYSGVFTVDKSCDVKAVAVRDTYWDSDVAQESVEVVCETSSARVTGKDRFVALLYENVLDRYAARSELDYWVDRLENGSTGADVAYGFIFSQEFTNKNYSDSDYVEHLYLSLMGRASDTDGKNDWVTHLQNGVSRKYVFRQFINSDEFSNLCNAYQIDKGDVTLDEARDENYNVTRFVVRNYKQFLGRDYDVDGLNDWTGRINGGYGLDQVAHGFVFSTECENMNLSNEEFVKILYRGIFDREADEAGLSDWTGRLNAGTSREDVFWGFANSQEFANLVASYGL